MSKYVFKIELPLNDITFLKIFLEKVVFLSGDLYSSGLFELPRPPRPSKKRSFFSKEEDEDEDGYTDLLIQYLHRIPRPAGEPYKSALKLHGMLSKILEKVIDESEIIEKLLSSDKEMQGIELERVKED